MNQNQETTFKERVIDGIDNFFRTKKFVLWIILGAIIAGIIIIFIVNNLSIQNREKYSLSAEEIQKKYSEWNSETDEVLKKEAEEEFLDLVLTAIDKYPKTYGTQRALYTRAQYYVKKLEWDKAAKDYLDLAVAFPKSALAAEGMLNAAVCYEELSNINDSLDIYNGFPEKYPEHHKLAYVLFSAGRIYESVEKYEEAAEKYRQLENDYITSSWTKLAQNRLIALVSDDKIKKAVE